MSSQLVMCICFRLSIHIISKRRYPLWHGSGIDDCFALGLRNGRGNLGIFFLSAGSIFTPMLTSFHSLKLMLGPNVVVILTSMKAVKEVNYRDSIPMGDLFSHSHSDYG